MAKIKYSWVDWSNGWQAGIQPAMEHHIVGQEVIIGEWIEDNIEYDLYRKTVNFGALPNATSKTFRHEIGDRDKITRIYGVAVGPINTLTIPFAANSNEYNIYVGVGKNLITITTGNDRTTFNAYITIEYIRKR